jgi:sterol desaturase/sphingolipid hydroxylase (fatty acid hydroxylase superfamily)
MTAPRAGDRTEREIPKWIGAALLAGTFGALLLAERRRPLRPAREPANRRLARNLAVAGLAAAVRAGTEMPLARSLARSVHRRRLGLLARVPLPEPVRTACACVLLDWTLYHWHVLTHRVPLLWRFHRVHHADLDLDASTALRFHFGEMLLSVPWRAAQIVAIGVVPRALSIWYALMLPAILFHHANLRLPPRVERWLCLFLVTPRLHGVHHSTRAHEVSSNWSSGLTVWDWLHGTLRWDAPRRVPRQPAEIGVPELRRAEQVTLGPLVRMPFAP